MTDSTPKPAGKRPTHIAYHIRETASEQEFWTRIGCAWPHSDGQGFNLELETLPLNGRLTLRIAAKGSE